MSIRRHTIYNLGGAIIPTAIGLVTIPIYLRVLGHERFGALSLIWISCAYVGFLDLGLNRALSYAVAKQGAGNLSKKATLVGTGLGVALCSGAVAAVLTYFLSLWYFETFFKADPVIIAEIIRALPLVALNSVTNVLFGVIYGALQGNREFLRMNIFATSMSSSLQIGPAVCLIPGLGSISAIMISVLILRFLSVAFGLRSLSKCVTGGPLFALSRSELRPLFTFSRWTFGISLIGPIILFSDKVLLGSLVSAEAVALYTIPFQLAQRITLVPSAVGSAIFPELVGKLRREQSAITGQALSYIFLIVTVPSLIVIFSAKTLLSWWLGPAVAAQVYIPCNVVIIAFWLNCASQIYHLSLVARDRPFAVFFIMLVELIIYIPILYLAIDRFGMNGAALSFLALYLFDALAMFGFSRLRNGDLRAVGAELLVLAAGLIWTIYSPDLTIIGVALLVLGCLVSVYMRRRLVGTLEITKRWRLRNV